MEFYSTGADLWFLPVIVTAAETMVLIPHLGTAKLYFAIE
jgi:hypothetical protein